MFTDVAGEIVPRSWMQPVSCVEIPWINLEMQCTPSRSNQVPSRDCMKREDTLSSFIPILTSYLVFESEDNKSKTLN